MNSGANETNQHNNSRPTVRGKTCQINTISRHINKNSTDNGRNQFNGHLKYHAYHTLARQQSTLPPWDRSYINSTWPE